MKNENIYEEFAKTLAGSTTAALDRIFMAAFMQREGREFQEADLRRLSKEEIGFGKGDLICLDNQPLVAFWKVNDVYTLDQVADQYLMHGPKVKYAYAPTLDEIKRGVGAKLELGGAQ